jgi:hypothetical protein
MKREQGNAVIPPRLRFWTLRVLDPIRLVRMVNEMGGLEECCKNARKDPIQLAWMVNKIARLSRRADNLLDHPHKADGVADFPSLLPLAHHLLHHPGKLDGVESAISKLALLDVALLSAPTTNFVL